MRAFLPILLILGCLPVSGIIFLNAEDPPANKETAPTGPYANSGWQYQVRYKNFQGTMISPKHFVTAAHLGQNGAVSQPQHFNGIANKTFTLKNEGKWTRIEDTDLAVFEIWETFDDYAPLYTNSDEVGKEFILMGKGRGRGEDVIMGGETVGWEWGDPSTEFDRWGVDHIFSTTTSSTGAQLLYSSFDANGGPLECQATGADSGGGWYIKDGPIWKLAAITFAADANHDINNIVGDASHFRAALTQARGLYFGSDGSSWEFIPTDPAEYLNPLLYETNPEDIRFYEKTHSYGTRISSYQTELNTIIQSAIAWGALDEEQRFTSWLSSFGITANIEAHDDADHDGIPNLLEYLIDSHPGDPVITSQPLTMKRLANGDLKFTIIETLDLSGRGLSWEIKGSTDLITWTTIGATIETGNTVDAISGIRTRTLELASPAPGTACYRLEVSLSN